MVVVVDPLYVTLFVDDARPLATLLVHDAAYFLFGSTEVIEAPSAHSHLRHKMYSHLNGAIIGAAHISRQQPPQPRVHVGSQLCSVNAVNRVPA